MEKIRLLDLPGLEANLTKGRKADALNDSAFELRPDAAGIDNGAAIEGDVHARNGQLAIGADCHLYDDPCIADEAAMRRASDLPCSPPQLCLSLTTASVCCRLNAGRLQNNRVVVRGKLDRPLEDKPCRLGNRRYVSRLHTHLGLRPARLTEYRRFLARSPVPIDNSEPTTGAQGRRYSPTQPRLVRHAMERVGHDDDIGLLARQLDNFVGVALDGPRWGGRVVGRRRYPR
jgi:hypothetical protein